MTRITKKQIAAKWQAEIEEKRKVRRYLLTEIPAALWDRVRHRAIDDRLNLRDLILKAIRFYLDSEN